MISKAEAAASLSEADAVGRRTRTAGGYAMAGPHLILWGAVWLVGYTFTGLVDPRSLSLVWLPLVLAGAVGATVLGRRARTRDVRFGATLIKSLVMAVSIALFFLAVYLVFQPATLAPYLVFPALVTALIYVVIGVYGWPRLGWIGAGMFVVSMSAYFFAGSYLPFCIALAGGGGLMLGGVWLRTV